MRLTAFFHPLATLASVTMLAALSLAGCSGTTPARPDAGTQPALSSSAPPVRIGIALGGGAAKGFAHIGVIKMLEANGFAPAVVSGTSAGSVVGALYASGMNAFEMQEKAVALDEAKIRDLQLSSGGLVLGQKLEDYVNEQVRRKPLEQMAKPFVVVATRLEDGERTVFARGNTGQAVRASSSVPGVFQPVTIGKYHFVDGGIVSPVPVDAARQLGALNQSIAIMGQKLGQAELARADVIVRPQVLDIGAADFSQRANAIVEGEKAALAVMPQIRERVAQLQAERAKAAAQAQQKAAEAQYQACLDNRSRLQKLAGLAKLDDSCPEPK